MSSQKKVELAERAPKSKNLGLSRSNDELSVATKLNSFHLEPRKLQTKPVVTPVYQGSIYERVPKLGFRSECGQLAYMYSRAGNPNHDEACMLINSLEGGTGSLIFPCGMSAISNTLMCFLSPGDHVVAPAPLYSGSQFVFDKYFTQYNIEVEYVPSYGTSDEVIEGYRKAIRPNTKIIYGETICNPVMWVLDVPKFAQLGKEKGVMTVVDATFTTPINLNAIPLGIDVVVQSGTKYFVGHSDMLSGAATLAKPEDFEKLRIWTIMMGTSVSPTEAALLVRSLRTLEIRVQRISENALRLAKYLETNKYVKRVLYCGLESHPHHELAKRILKGFCGMMTIELQSKDFALSLVENTRLFRNAGSLGGNHSLISHIATQSHSNYFFTNEKREAMGITESMVRISLGLEDVKDLIDDINLAFERVNAELKEKETASE